MLKLGWGIDYSSLESSLYYHHELCIDKQQTADTFTKPLALISKKIILQNLFRLVLRIKQNISNIFVESWIFEFAFKSANFF